eukprot:jgi/Picsp_1/2397/NSC_05858-R1_expressed protein [Chlorella variabilis]
MSFFVQAFHWSNKIPLDDSNDDGRMTRRGGVAGQPIDLVSTSTLRHACEVDQSVATDERSLGEQFMPETPPLDGNELKTNSFLTRSEGWWGRRTRCQPLDSDTDCSVRAHQSIDESEGQQCSSIVGDSKGENGGIDQSCRDVSWVTKFSEPSEGLTPQRRGFGAIDIGVDARFAAEIRHLRNEIESYRRNQNKIEDALRIKNQEVENLRCIVRQLGESRADALAARSDMAEKMCELQRELSRLSHVATLSREVSRENVELTKIARREATSAQTEVDTVKKDAALSLVSEQKLYVQNKELIRKVRQLEISGDVRESRIVESY